jgi:hypothetical protein
MVFLSQVAVSGENRPLKIPKQLFASFEYRPLLHPELLKGQSTFVDQIYRKGSKAILLKLGLKPKSKNTLGKLLPHEKGFYYHAENYLKQIELKNVVKVELLQWVIGSQAWAETKTCEHDPKDILVSFGDQLNQQTIQEIAWTCSSAASEGVKNKAEETIELLNPENLLNVNVGNFWDESVKTYEMLKELVPQLEPMMNELSGLLEKFHPSLKINLICSAIGSQSVEAITPGGVIKKLVFLKSKIEGLKKFMAMLKGMSKLYEKFPKSKTLEEATRRVGACAI